MAREHSNRIERLDLSEHFFINYRVADGETLYFHAHNGFELLFVHEGAGQVIIGERLLRAERGSLLLFQPFQLHKVHYDTGSPAVRSVIVFDPVLVDRRLDAFPSLQRFFRLLWKHELPVQLFPMADRFDEMERLLDHYYRALGTDDQVARQEELCLCLMALLQLLRAMFFAEGRETARISKQPRPMGHAEKAMQWVEAHYGEAFDLNRMAEQLYVSPSHLSRLFHQETGSTLSEYVTARRLREACLLLSATELPVRDIAHRIGIGSGPYFGELFKKRFGMTPLQYRAGTKNGQRGSD